MEPVVKGHPMHPTIIPIPVGTLPASFTLDVLARLTGDDDLANAAFYNMLIGSVGAVPAAITGLLDYLEMAPNDPAKKMATTHGLMNVGLIALYGMNLLLRLKNRRSPFGFLLSAIGTGSLLVSGWLGGEIAYGRGWRVRNAERFELEWQKEKGVGPFAAEGKQPGATEADFPPETVRGFREKKSGQKVFEEIRQSGANSATSGQSTASASPTEERPEPAVAASDLNPGASQGKGVDTNDFPSQAEGDRATIEATLNDINRQDNSQQQPT